jgi:hypothetical protein
MAASSAGRPGGPTENTGESLAFSDAASNRAFRRVLYESRWCFSASPLQARLDLHKRDHITSVVWRRSRRSIEGGRDHYPLQRQSIRGTTRSISNIGGSSATSGEICSRQICRGGAHLPRIAPGHQTARLGMGDKTRRRAGRTSAQRWAFSNGTRLRHSIAGIRPASFPVRGSVHGLPSRLDRSACCPGRPSRCRGRLAVAVGGDQGRHLGHGASRTVEWHPTRVWVRPRS